MADLHEAKGEEQDVCGKQDWSAKACAGLEQHRAHKVDGMQWTPDLQEMHVRRDHGLGNRASSEHTHDPRNRSRVSEMESHAYPHKMRTYRSTADDRTSAEAPKRAGGMTLTSKNSDSEARSKLIGRAASARCLRARRAGSVFWGHAGIVAGINSLRG